MAPSSTCGKKAIDSWGVMGARPQLIGQPSKCRGIAEPSLPSQMELTAEMSTPDRDASDVDDSAK